MGWKSTKKNNKKPKSHRNGDGNPLTFDLFEINMIIFLYFITRLKGEGEGRVFEP